MKKLVNLLCLTAAIIGQKPNYNFDLYATSEIHGSFEVPQETKNIAYNTNRMLGLSKFFDTSNIINSQWVNNEFHKDSTHSEFSVTTDDGHQLKSSFFNRGKNKLIVVGPGFTNPKETMAPFTHMFLDYDVIIVNFRGLGIKENLTLNPLYHTLGIDCKTQIGHSEYQDLFAVVEWARQNKKYKSVTGLGVCLGAFVCAKAQGIAEANSINLFDSLILDGCWLSANKAKDKIIADPMLIINPQTGGAPQKVKDAFKKEFVHKNIIRLVEFLFDLNLDDLDLEDYLKKITKTPTLLFYGKDDKLIYRNEFETIFNSIGGQEKAAIITNNPHVHNHLRSKEVYKLMCELFIDNGIQKTFELLQSPSTLEAYLKQSNYTSNYNDILKPRRIKTKKSNTKRNVLIAALATAASYKLYKSS